MCGIFYRETKIVKYISFFDDASGCLYRGGYSLHFALIRFLISGFINKA